MTSAAVVPNVLYVPNVSFLPGRYTSLNPVSNRADRRYRSKIRQSKPGAFGGKQRERIAAWAAKSPEEIEAIKAAQCLLLGDD